MSTTRWIDIVPPPESASGWLLSDTLLVLFLGGLLLVSASILWRSPKFRCLYHTWRLRAQWQRGMLSSRELLFRLVQQLQLAWGVQTLEAADPGGGKMPRWRDFCAAMREQRFAPPEPADDTVDELSRQVLTWLWAAPLWWWRRHG